MRKCGKMNEFEVAIIFFETAGILGINFSVNTFGGVVSQFK